MKRQTCHTTGFVLALVASASAGSGGCSSSDVPIGDKLSNTTGTTGGTPAGTTASGDAGPNPGTTSSGDAANPDDGASGDCFCGEPIDSPYNERRIPLACLCSQFVCPSNIAELNVCHDGATAVTRSVGCGRTVIQSQGPLTQGKVAFDSASGALVGAEVISDGPLMCLANGFIAGDLDCATATTCTLCASPTFTPDAPPCADSGDAGRGDAGGGDAGRADAIVTPDGSSSVADAALDSASCPARQPGASAALPVWVRYAAGAPCCSYPSLSQAPSGWQTYSEVRGQCESDCGCIAKGAADLNPGHIGYRPLSCLGTVADYAQVLQAVSACSQGVIATKEVGCGQIVLTNIGLQTSWIFAADSKQFIGYRTFIDGGILCNGAYTFVFGEDSTCPSSSLEQSCDICGGSIGRACAADAGP